MAEKLKIQSWQRGGAENFMNPEKPKDPERQREGELIATIEAKFLFCINKCGARKFQTWKESCIEMISRTYPDPKERPKYRLYHVLIGGGGYQEAPYFDFPEGCSIIKMIEDLRSNKI